MRILNIFWKINKFFNQIKISERIKKISDINPLIGKSPGPGHYQPNTSMFSIKAKKGVSFPKSNKLPINNLDSPSFYSIPREIATGPKFR